MSEGQKTRHMVEVDVVLRQRVAVEVEVENGDDPTDLLEPELATAKATAEALNDWDVSFEHRRLRGE